PRGGHRVAPDGDPAQNRRVRPDARAIFHARRHDLPIARIRPRVEVVRKANMRTDEHAVADRHAAVDRREVLDLAPIPKDDVRIDVHVLSDSAVPPDPRPLADLDPMPDLRALANGRPWRDLRGGVDPDRHRTDAIRSEEHTSELQSRFDLV